MFSLSIHSEVIGQSTWIIIQSQQPAFITLSVTPHSDATMTFEVLELIEFSVVSWAQRKGDSHTLQQPTVITLNL